MLQNAFGCLEWLVAFANVCRVFFVNYFNTKNNAALAKQKPRHGKQCAGFAICNEGILLLCGAK